MNKKTQNPVNTKQECTGTPKVFHHSRSKYDAYPKEDLINLASKTNNLEEATRVLGVGSSSGLSKYLKKRYNIKYSDIKSSFFKRKASTDSTNSLSSNTIDHEMGDLLNILDKNTPVTSPYWSDCSTLESSELNALKEEHLDWLPDDDDTSHHL